MKRTIFTSLLFSTLLISTSAFSEPASKISVEKLMQRTGAGQLGLQVMNQMLPSLKKMIPDAPETFWRDFMAEVDANEMVNMVIPIYQKYLTEEDVKVMNRFYDSETGKKLIRVQPNIMRESMLLGQQWGQNIAQRVLTKYKEQAKKE